MADATGVTRQSLHHRLAKKVIAAMQFHRQRLENAKSSAALRRELVETLAARVDEVRRNT